MARQGQTKRAVRGKARALPVEGSQKAGVKQARVKGARSKPGAAKAARARVKAGRARPATTTTADAGDATIESRLARLEEMALLQAERSDELFKQVEAVLADSDRPDADQAGASA